MPRHASPVSSALHSAYLPMQRSRPSARWRRTSGRMEPLEELRAKIDGFPGYDGDIERRRSDEYVRSYLGEALAKLAAQRTLPTELAQRLDDLVLRAGFADPRAFAPHRGAAGGNGSRDVSALAAADAEVVKLADRAASAGASGAAAFLDEVTAALDRRDAAMRAAAASTP